MVYFDDLRSVIDMDVECGFCLVEMTEQLKTVQTLTKDDTRPN